MTRKKGFTLIELVMVVAIIAILSVSGAHLMAYLVQNSVFIPNQLNMDMIGSEALNIMIEGDSQAKGLRNSRIVTQIADNTITFKNQDSQVITYRLDTAIGKLYRSISGAAEALIPYYLGSGITVAGKSSKLFTYYDSSEVETNVAASVRRIKVALIAQTGTGSYSDWEGISEQASSIAVDKFE